MVGIAKDSCMPCACTQQVVEGIRMRDRARCQNTCPKLRTTYESFHWNCHTPEIHQIEKLEFLGTNSNPTKISIWICAARYWGIWVSRSDGFRGCCICSGRCHSNTHTRHTASVGERHACEIERHTYRKARVWTHACACMYAHVCVARHVHATHSGQVFEEHTHATQCEIHTEESVCMSIDSGVSMHVCTCACVHVCTCACMHVCPCVCTHVCTRVRIFIHTRACIYTHVLAYVLCIYTHRVHSATFELERLTVHLCHALLTTAHPIVIRSYAAAHTNLYVWHDSHDSYVQHDSHVDIAFHCLVWYNILFYNCDIVWYGAILCDIAFHFMCVLCDIAFHFICVIQHFIYAWYNISLWYSNLCVYCVIQHFISYVWYSISLWYSDSLWVIQHCIVI